MTFDQAVTWFAVLYLLAFWALGLILLGVAVVWAVEALAIRLREWRRRRSRRLR